MCAWHNARMKLNGQFQTSFHTSPMMQHNLILLKCYRCLKQAYLGKGVSSLSRYEQVKKGLCTCARHNARMQMNGQFQSCFLTGPLMQHNLILLKCSMFNIELFGIRRKLFSSLKSIQGDQKIVNHPIY